MTKIVNAYNAGGREKFNDGRGECGSTVLVVEQKSGFEVHINGEKPISLSYSQICPDYCQLRYTPKGMEALARALSSLADGQSDLRVLMY